MAPLSGGLSPVRSSSSRTGRPRDWCTNLAASKNRRGCIRAEMCRCGKVADALWPGQGSGQQSGLCRDCPNR